MATSSEPQTVTAAVREAWNGATGARWVDDAERFDALLHPMGEALLGVAGVTGGEHILEVGCGTGRLTIGLAGLVGDQGEVVGVDVSAPMLRLAADRIGEAGLSNVRLVESDAANVALPPAAFDALVSRFGVMFFGDPPVAFTHLAGLLRPGGRLAVVTWRAMPESEFFALPVSIAMRHAAEALATTGPPELPGPFSLADPVELRALLDAAGLVDVEIAAVDRQLVAGHTVDDAMAFLSRGSWYDAVRNAAPAAIPAIEADLRTELAARLGPDGVTATGAAWLVTARRP